MNCDGCGKEVKDDFTWCPYCSKHLGNKDFSMNIANFGDHNINIGGSNSAQQKIYINKHIQSSKREVEYADRYDQRVLGGVKGYKKKFEISAVISLVSGIITIQQYFTTSPVISLFLMLTVGTVYYSYSSFERYKSLRDKGIVVKEGVVVLEEDEGEVYTVRKYGICPICNGKVYIDKYPNSKSKRRFGRCQNNQDHLYTYDHTIDQGELIKATYYE